MLTASVMSFKSWVPGEIWRWEERVEERRRRGKHCRNLTNSNNQLIKADYSQW